MSRRRRLVGSAAAAARRARYRHVKPVVGRSKKTGLFYEKSTVPGTINVESFEQVISPRGRGRLETGMPDPFQAPAPDMPQSKQDYFLSSRAIQSMHYDVRQETAQVKFQKGGEYLLFNFPQELWEKWKRAQSKGRFFVYNIRPRYQGRNGRYRRIR